ncbi:hypothetical protein D9615_004029 [Tricholomella constricta]|uniref:Uncharacterized protein n=1 Tax=Tricholomella constricta TaxID=117010 RepID=A0A8H5M4G6_9AGAR|nr:hypothetical protein D9615_004029 [Tricholomella constricta]
MNSWPADDRIQLATDTARKGESKAKQKAPVRNYLDLERGPNAVTLVERDGRLEWTSIVKNVIKGPNHLHMGKCTTIYPATRSTRDPQIKNTILQSAERGANFLRTYLPDVDIPAELIRDELSQDAKITQRLEVFDPYMGNLLEPVMTRDATFLAFPMGELNRDLNLSPFCQSENSVIFKPSAHPTRTFDTPIQQVSASRPPGATGLHTPYLAVRTFGLTSVFEVNTSQTTPYLAEAVTVLHADTANRALVDICLSPSPFGALLVTDLGSVYKCGISSGRKYLNVVHTPAHDVGETTRDLFWRLAGGVDDVNYFLASKKSLVHIDLRTTNTSQGLFSLPGQRDVLTSIEDQKGDNIIKLCSTREILWIDTRFPGKPLLGYRHGRAYDRHLEARTIPLSSASTLLTSRDNALVTVYDVSRSEGQLLHVNAPPYCFIPGNDASASHLGQALFKHPLDKKDNSFSLIRLTERGCLQKVDLRISDADFAPVFETSWTTDVKQLDAKSLHPREAPHDKQAFIEVDLSGAYDHIFKVHEQGREKLEEENANAVYDLLETIPTFWQEVEPPLEHMITTYDAVFRAGDDPHQNARADFLTESIINSTRGYRAMFQGRLSPKTLVGGASWHYNIAPILRHFESDFADDIQSGTEVLRGHDLAEDPERSAESLRYENEAREQLALDMALSTDIFSGQPFLNASEEGSELETMARTLSLGGEPPSVDFGYLRPRHTNYYNKGEEKEKEVAASMGVRSLLKGWEIGADPEEYLFVDHYDEGASEPQPIRRAKPSQAPGTQSQRPPMILATSTVPPRPPEVVRRMLGAHSQGSATPPLTIGFGSQEYMTSTQVLPGVHGGRPSMAKKKIAKKRVGGF